MRSIVLAVIVLGGALTGPAWADSLASGSASVIGPAQLMVGGKAVRLDDVRMPGEKARCSEWRGPKQVPFDCHLHAEAFMKSLVAGRDVSCVVGEGGVGTCYADGKDLAAAAVAAGWATSCGQTSRYTDLNVGARNAQHGMWAGNFTLDTQCPAARK